MKKDSRFIVLHLSDVHIGKSKADQEAVLDPLLANIESIKNERNLPPDLIVFSGDIVQGCKDICGPQYCVKGTPTYETCKLEKQYEEAEQFFQKLFKRLSIQTQEVPLLIVPGNHDVNRHLVTDEQLTARESYTVKGVEKKQINCSGRSWQSIMKNQERWLKFAKAISSHPDIVWNNDFHIPHGIIEHNGIKIGFAGLNSSWIAGDDHDEKNLWIGREQHTKVSAAIKEADFKIVSVHHPCTWLNKLESKFMSNRIESDFDICFHGHVHETWYRPMQDHLAIEGGALYEHSDKKNAYSWLELDFVEQSTKIHLFEFSEVGKRCWIPAHIPSKTNESGIGEITTLFNDPLASKLVTKSGEKYVAATNYKLSDSLDGVIKQLEDQFNVTWEPQLFNFDAKNIHVFWPIRLRQPTAIHASQCFIAAALQKRGCIIDLYIDNFGRGHSEPDFLVQIKKWFKKVGGKEEEIIISKYEEISSGDREKKRETLEALLLAEIETTKVLKISKLWPSDGTPEKIIEALTKKPRRLLTPAMTWTCLRSLAASQGDISIITLGGYDEKILWDTWRNCLDETTLHVGHLYLSELEGLHMASRDFTWSSKAKIKREFTNAIADQHSEVDMKNSMIPWCVNNCALVPMFVAEEQILIKNGVPIKTIESMEKKFDKTDVNFYANEVAKWVL